MTRRPTLNDEMSDAREAMADLGWQIVKVVRVDRLYEWVASKLRKTAS